jgi:acetylglutamate kinase
MVQGSFVIVVLASFASAMSVQPHHVQAAACQMQVHAELKAMHL